MKRLLFLAALALSSPAVALDNNQLAQNLREMLNLDTRTEIVVQGKPVASGISNLQKISVLVGGAPYDVLITSDHAKYIWGFTADLKVSPDKTRAALISLDNVRSTGSATAPVTVVEYSDMQCSHCEKAHEIMTQNLYKTYSPSQVRWVFKHFPLNSHEWAIPAAAATECAGDQKPDAFWSMLDMFFKNQDNVEEATVGGVASREAARLGLDVKKFKACMESPKTRERVMADKKEGSAAGVNSTPSFFINGRARRGVREWDEIKAVIDEKLKAAAK